MDNERELRSLDKLISLDLPPFEGVATPSKPLGPAWVKAADVPAQEVDWLFEERIPLGKFTLLEGDPGGLKSFMTLSWAASVSTGGRSHSTMPGFVERPPANVLVLTAEDGLGDTIVPRLNKLGADLSRITLLGVSLDYDLLLNDQGFADLRYAMRDMRPNLCIIDPLIAFTGAAVDIHRTNEVRAITKKIAALSEEFHAASVGVRHLTKDSKSKAIYKGIGSIDFTAAARSVMQAGLEPESNTHALVMVKASLAALARGLSYEYSDEQGIVWLGETDITAGDLQASDAGQGIRKKDEAVAWLEQYLSNDDKPSKEIDREAAVMGIAPRTLRRAKEELRIISTPIGNKQGSGGMSEFLLSLPPAWARGG